MKKHLLAILCFLCFGFIVQTHAQSIQSAQSAQSTKDTQGNNYLYVHSKDGTAKSYELSKLQKMTFAQAGMTLHLLSGGTEIFSQNEVSVLTFEDEPLIPVKNVATVQYDKINIYYNSLLNSVTISSTSQIREVSLFSMQGILLKKINANSLSVEMSLSGYSSGIYLVRATDIQGTVVKKIIKHI
ncbi:MAG: T9SS type A sorting domain-containing protein [Bacteroidales bacterium]|jgi:hypothetical protein|nr:T9SS type A sorting domain-containing protein [Bacteroidales bacterium]